VSGWILAKRNRERKTIRREILELQPGRRARVAPSWNVRLDAGEYKTLRVARRF